MSESMPLSDHHLVRILLLPPSPALRLFCYYYTTGSAVLVLLPGFLTTTSRSFQTLIPVVYPPDLVHPHPRSRAYVPFPGL